MYKKLDEYPISGDQEISMWILIQRGIQCVIPYNNNNPYDIFNTLEHIVINNNIPYTKWQNYREKKSNTRERNKYGSFDWTEWSNECTQWIIWWIIKWMCLFVDSQNDERLFPVNKGNFIEKNIIIHD